VFIVKNEQWYLEDQCDFIEHVLFLISCGIINFFAIHEFLMI